MVCNEETRGYGALCILLLSALSEVSEGELVRIADLEASKQRKREGFRVACR